MASAEPTVDDRFPVPCTDGEETIPRTLRSVNTEQLYGSDSGSGMVQEDQDKELQYSDIKIGKELGSGATSTVFQALLHHPHRGHKEVAVKSIFNNLNKEEISLLRMFKDNPHPNIIQFLGYLKNEREHLLVTELAPRGSLFDFLQRSPSEAIPLFVAQKWIKDIADGIEFLHGNKVVHRDIKSPNCLLFQDGLVKICDFGIAKVTEASITQKTSHLRGSTRWMAPEMLMSLVFSKPSDIYSFGMVILEVCTRKLPFSELDGMALLMRDMNKLPSIPKSCPNIWRQIMLWCWKAQTMERPTIGEVVNLLNRECQQNDDALIQQWEVVQFPEEHQAQPLVSNEVRVLEEKYVTQERAMNQYAEEHQAQPLVSNEARVLERAMNQYAERETAVFDDKPKTSPPPEEMDNSLYESEEYPSSEADSQELTHNGTLVNIGHQSGHGESQISANPPNVSSMGVQCGATGGATPAEGKKAKDSPLSPKGKPYGATGVQQREETVGVYIRKSKESPSTPSGAKYSAQRTTGKKSSAGGSPKRHDRMPVPAGTKLKKAQDVAGADDCAGLCGAVAGLQVSSRAKSLEVPLVGASKKIPSNKKCKLSEYMCDLQVKLSGDGFSAKPLTEGGFVYIWAGVKATHGVKSGKVCFEVKVTEDLDTTHHAPGGVHIHVARVGWSTVDSSLHLGKDKLSYGYGGTGQKSCWDVFRSYGKKFGKGDVITCYIDFTGKFPIISYAKNGEECGLAHSIKDDLQGRALYPHVLMKNAGVEVNLGQKKPSCAVKKGFTFVRNLPEKDCVFGPQPPASKHECEVLMMIGLSGSGKTTWAKKHCKANPDKHFVILGTNQLMDEMKYPDLSHEYSERWKQLFKPANECYEKLLEMASKKRHNYVLDQTNLYPVARKRKIRWFEDFTCKAVVVVPPRATHEERSKKLILHDQRTGIPEKDIRKMKADFKLPDEREIPDLFSEAQYVELQHGEASSLLDEYKEEVLLAS